MCLLECQKALLSEHPPGVNVFASPKHCSGHRRDHFYPNFPLIQQKLSWKTYLRIRSKMLGLFVKILMGDNMYSAHRSKKIAQQIQTQLS